MNFVNVNKPNDNVVLPLGTLVIETGDRMLTNDSISGLKVDENHVLALGENEATLLEFPEGVDAHFGSMKYVYPDSIGIGLSPQLTGMIQEIQEQKNPSLETVEYQLNKQKDKKLSEFPKTDDDLYDQVKGAVQMPIDFDFEKNDSTEKSLAVILFDKGLSKVQKMNRIVQLMSSADTSASKALAGNIIKDLRGKHLSNAEIYSKYEYLQGLLNEPKQEAKSGSDESIEVPSNSLDENNPEDIKALTELIEKLKEVSPESSINLLDKVKTDSKYLGDGLNTLKGRISEIISKLGASSKEAKEEVNKSLDMANHELSTGQKLSVALNGLLNSFKKLLGNDEPEQPVEQEKPKDKEKDDDNDFAQSLAGMLSDAFGGIDFDEFYKEDDNKNEELLLLRQYILNKIEKGSNSGFESSDVSDIVERAGELGAIIENKSYDGRHDALNLLHKISYELSDPDYDLDKCWSLLSYYVGEIDKLLNK